MRSTSVLLLLLLVLLAACGQQVYRSEEGSMELSGVVQVVSAGSGSEGVILEADSAGEVFALLGERAEELAPLYGQHFLVRGLLLDSGEDPETAWFPIEGLRAIRVLDYTLLGAPEPGDPE